MKYADEYSLRKRLTTLFPEHEADLGVVVPNPKRFIRQAARTTEDASSDYRRARRLGASGGQGVASVEVDGRTLD